MPPSALRLGSLDRLPPALRHRLRLLSGWLPEGGGALSDYAAAQLAQLLVDGEGWLGAEPELCEVGYWMLEAGRPVALRRQACAWLASFPTVETARRLAAVAADPATPAPVRDQAIWALGYRQARGLHPAVTWDADALQVADDALARLADEATAAGEVVGERLAHALRHVQAEAVAAAVARAPGMWGDALEGFATPATARVLLVRLDDVGAAHRLRAARLVAATLGAEALPLLRARAAAAPLDEALELRQLAVALGGEPELGALEARLRGLRFAELARQRARWHLAHPGVIPTVRGLRVARVTATLPPAERAAACARAADDLAALAPFGRHAEAYVYALWAWMVRGAQDPARARTLVEAHPDAQGVVRELWLEDLARRGRVRQLAAVVQAHGGADLGALLLAIHGRPLAALELAAVARLHTPTLACARALGCYRAGRPDLAARLLAEDPPPAEPCDEGTFAVFPGPDERWRVEHGAPGAAPLAALAGGLPAVVALAAPAPADAEPDLPSLAPVEAVRRRLGGGLPGATVYLAGEFAAADRAAVRAAIERAGARLVEGPFPGTDYYLPGAWCAVQTIAQLERQGARRLRRGDVEGL